MAAPGDIETNRDLYRFVAALTTRRSETDLTLAAYLERLRGLARAHCERPTLPPSLFAALLDDAFDGPPTVGPAPTATADGYADWERYIDQQIGDLHALQRSGDLTREDRYFGIDAPSGARWYNFEPSAFLEAAVAGTFGGWEEGDDTARMYVPGPVAVVDGSGEVTAAAARDIEEAVLALPGISWEEFSDFLESGQSYE